MLKGKKKAGKIGATEFFLIFLIAILAIPVARAYFPLASEQAAASLASAAAFVQAHSFELALIVLPALAALAIAYRGFPMYEFVDLETMKRYRLGRIVEYFSVPIADRVFDAAVVYSTPLAKLPVPRLVASIFPSLKKHLFITPVGKIRFYEGETYRGSPLRPELTAVPKATALEAPLWKKAERALRKAFVPFHTPKPAGRWLLATLTTKEEVLASVWADAEPDIRREAWDALRSPMLRDAYWISPPAEAEEWLNLMKNSKYLAQLELEKHRSIRNIAKGVSERVRALIRYVASEEGVVGVCNDLLDCLTYVIENYYTAAEIYAMKLGIPPDQARLVEEEIMAKKSPDELIEELARARERAIRRLRAMGVAVDKVEAIAARLEKLERKLEERKARAPPA